MQHPRKAGDLGDDLLSDEDRKTLLRRLDDPFAYLTGNIPVQVDFGSKPFRLRDFIKHQKAKTDYRERDLKVIAWVLKHLDDIIETEKGALKRGTGLSPEGAEVLVKRTQGLLRARVLLSEMIEGQDLDPIDVDKEKELEDVRRWMDYSKKIG